MREQAATQSSGKPGQTGRALEQREPAAQPLGSPFSNRTLGSLLAAGSNTAQPSTVPASGRVEPPTKRRNGRWLREDAKARFLERLKRAVSSAADAGLAGSGRTAAGCPTIEQIFSYYALQSAAAIERAIRSYAPESVGARDSEAIISFVAARAQRAAEQWSLSGEITGVPSDVPRAALSPERDVGASSPARAASVLSRLGPGQPLSGLAQSRMEAAFGRPFQDVRVHSATPEAARLDARAFAVGNHIGFAPGEFQPGTETGDALLAHELAHVGQQGGRPAPAGEAAVERDANRSAERAMLQLGSGGRRSPAPMPGLATGLRLSRCGGSGRPRYQWQDAALKRLVDDEDTSAQTIYSKLAGRAPAQREAAQRELEAARRDYVGFLQTLEDGSAQRALKRKIRKLDTIISLLQRDIATGLPRPQPGRETEYPHGSAPPELLAGTHALTAAEQAEVNREMSPMPEAKFSDKHDGETFRNRLRPVVVDAIHEQHKLNYQRVLPARTAPGGLFGWPHLEGIANSAKREVDRVFGAFPVRPAFQAQTTLQDRWERVGALLPTLSNEQKLVIAKQRVQKILKDDKTVAAIYREHGFTPGSKGQADLDALTTELAVAHRDELLQIHQAWSAAAPAGFVEIQRTRVLPESGSEAARHRADLQTRQQLYRYFGTLVHEYLHTMAHTRYRQWFDHHITDEFREHTMREGMTDAFTKIVLESVNFNDEALRRAIEGPFFANQPRIDGAALRNYYPAHREAQAIIARVGLRNAMAAYFLGEVELLGGKVP